MEKQSIVMEHPDIKAPSNTDDSKTLERDVTTTRTTTTMTTKRPDQPSDAVAAAAEPVVAENDHEYVTGVKLTVVMISVTLVGFLIMLDTSIISTAIPRITSDFHSLPDVGWYGSAYLLANCSLQPLTGKLYTHFGSKSTFLVFFAVFELGSLLCGVAVSSNMLIVSRAVAGLGSAGLMNGALTIIAACVPLRRRPFYLGIMFSVAQIGIVLGPLMGGLLTQYTTWRWCFYINLPLGAAVAILLLLISIPDITVKDTSPDKPTWYAVLGKLDLIGFALFAPTSIQFLLALQWGGTRYAWSSSTIIGLFCGGAGLCAIFLGWEYRKGDAAMIPLSMVKQKVVASSCLVMFFFIGSMMIVSYYLPIYFQAVRGVTPTMSGVYTLPIILSQMVSAVLSGYLVSKFGSYVLWGAISGILTSIGVGLISTYTPDTATGVWIGYQILAGAGRGCGIQMPIVAIQNFLPQDKVSIGMSLCIFAQNFGGALFLTLAETIFTNGLDKGLAIYAPGVNAQAVIDAGATAVQEAVPSSSLDGVLLAYNLAVSHVFYLAAGAAVAVFVFSWGMGWTGLKKEKEVATDEMVQI